MLGIISGREYDVDRRKVSHLLACNGVIEY
jgi:hypothetical protein